MENIIIAVVGLTGTGKSEVTSFIAQNYSFKPIYFGGYILSEVKRRSLEVNSQNERLVREELRSVNGMDVVAKLSHSDIQATLDNGHNVVIDGLYSFSEYRYLKGVIHNRFILLAIHSSKELRYQRLGSRKYRPLTPMEIDNRDYFELKNLEKCEPIILADYHIVNDQSVEELHRRIEGILSQLSTDS